MSLCCVISVAIRMGSLLMTLYLGFMKGFITFYFIYIFLDINKILQNMSC